MNPSPKKILVVRQDNIGDLVCTTPLLEGLNTHWPDAEVHVLCTSYNREVLARNPHVSQIHAYTKGSHHGSTGSLIVGALQKVWLILHLRRGRFDLAISATTPSGSRIDQLTRLVRPRRIIRAADGEDTPDTIPNERLAGLHEVERCWELGRTAGLEGLPPWTRIYPDPARRLKCREGFLQAVGPDMPTRFVAVHISSRKPSQQWPAASFADLLTRLHRADNKLAFVILWAPGGEAEAAHSGDDDKAARLASLLDPSVPAIFRPTPDLAGTIEALSACDAFIGSDGGAMHLAAACKLPVVALFGASDANRWRPWARFSEVLQPASKNVADISPGEVAAAFAQLPSRQEPSVFPEARYGAKNAGSR